MTPTATLVQRGPINGMFTEAAALYELSQPFFYEGKLFDHLIVSHLPEDKNGPEDTLALPASPQGFVFLGSDWAYNVAGDVEGHGHLAALAALGYELVTADV